MKKLFNLAFSAGILSFLLSFAFVLLLYLIEILSKRKTGFDGFGWAQPIALVLVCVFALSVLLLWIEGWSFVISGWPARTPAVNALCVLFLLFGPVFAAFTFHVLGIRRKRS